MSERNRQTWRFSASETSECEAIDDYMLPKAVNATELHL